MPQTNKWPCNVPKWIVSKEKKNKRKKCVAIAGNSDSKSDVIPCGMNKPISQHSHHPQDHFPNEVKVPMDKKCQNLF